MIKRHHWAIIAPIAAILLVGGFLYYFFVARVHESTDDAFIDGHILPVNSKVAGQVIAIHVLENQVVKKGDPLVEIDPQDYTVKLAQAEAEAAASRAQARQAQTDADRAKKLFAKDEISREVYDHAIAAAEIARAKADLADKKVAEAHLNLDDTKITAPADGRIGRKSVELKSFVQVGQPLMAVVTSDVWVTANFKETQLGKMRPGQKVAIDVDAFPGREFHGHVDSFQPGTGSRFSLFPPENASGNFVKVVQRVPVKIVFDEPADQLAGIAPGMSAVPTVDLR